VTQARWLMLADRFMLGAPRAAPRYVTRGAMGEIWRLDTARVRWAVKWQFPWAPADPRPPDLAVQAAAARAGIPLPGSVTTPAGDAVVRIEDRPARVYEWVDTGAPLAPPADPATAAQAGRLLGLLHRLALPAGGPIDPWYTTPPTAAAWADLAGRAAAAGVPWAAALAAARPVIDELAALAEGALNGDGEVGGEPAVVGHRDFTPANVLPRPGGGLVVLDWEDSGPLPPGRELGSALLAWCGGAAGAECRCFDAASAAALAGGYAAAAGHRPPVDSQCFATAAAVHINFLHVMAGQALDDPQHRTFAERQLAGLLDGGLDRLRRDIGLACAALGD
jgi:aminoglycoside phosphotransferase (APT) family kinase protein